MEMQKKPWFFKGLTALLLAASAAFASNWEVPLEVSTSIIVAWNDGITTPSKPVVLRGENAALESTSTVLDTEMTRNTISVYTSTTSRGFAAWNDGVTNQFLEASRTFEPIDETANLLRALEKKRLIYQPTRYP